MIYSLFVPMKPQPKERARVCKGHSYTPARTLAAERNIRLAWIAAGLTRTPLTRPLKAELCFVFLRPKSRAKLQEKWHSIRPDADNCGKLIFDALNGVAYEDDAQICQIIASKTYTDDPQKEGVHISIETI